MTISADTKVDKWSGPQSHGKLFSSRETCSGYWEINASITELENVPTMDRTHLRALTNKKSKR
jgi:hypothetical protein